MRRFATLALALIGACVVASCGLLGGGFLGGERPRQIAIPTSTVVPDGDEIVFAELQDDGTCLFVATRTTGRPNVLPIWPAGFSAKVGPMDRLLFSGPDQESNAFVAGSELMELHGEFVDAPPPDAVIPAGCEGLPLFHVGEAFNRAP
jgi:hypothetical protein